MIAAKGGASEPLNLGLPGKAGGAAAVRRTLASTICRIAVPTLVARPRQLRDVSTVMRFQPAHQSMINRRHDGRASCLAWYSPKQALERKPRIYAPATWKGGHDSGLMIKNKAGNAIENTLVGIANRAMADMARFSIALSGVFSPSGVETEPRIAGAIVSQAEFARQHG